MLSSDLCVEGSSRRVSHSLGPSASLLIGPSYRLTPAPTPCGSRFREGERHRSEQRSSAKFPRPQCVQPPPLFLPPSFSPASYHLCGRGVRTREGWFTPCLSACVPIGMEPATGGGRSVPRLTLRISHEGERAADARIRRQPDRDPPHWLNPLGFFILSFHLPTHHRGISANTPQPRYSRV